MAERLHPGVYVEEVKPLVLAIEGVSTSTAAFIGVADRGPVNIATLVTSFTDYQRVFGGYRSDSFLTYSVQSFFNNGGKKCYIVRVAVNATTATITLADRENPVQAERALTISAANAGKWGNDLDILILDSTVDPVNEFKLAVKFRSDTVETFDNLSMDPARDNFVENVIQGSSQYITVKVVSAAQTNAPGVLVSGDLDPATLSVALPANFNLQLDGDATVRVIAISGTSPITSPTVLAAAIQTGMHSPSPAPTPGTALANSYAAATCEAVPFGSKVRLIIHSGLQGTTSSVLVTAGAANDVAGTLKLLAPDVSGVNGVATYLGTSTSGNEPARSTTSAANTMIVNIDGDGPKTIVLQPPLTSGVNIAKAITAAVKDPGVIPNDPAYKPAYDNFAAVYTDRYKLNFGNTNTGALTFTVGNNTVTDATGLRITGKTAAVTATAGATVQNDHSMSLDEEPSRDLSAISTPILTLTLSGPALTINCPLTGDLTSGENIALAIQTAVTAKAAASDAGINADTRKVDILASLARFTCQYVANYQLTVGSVPSGDPRDSALQVVSASASDAAEPLKLGSPNGGTEQNGSALLRPILSSGGDFHVGDHPMGLLIRDVSAGSDGTAPTDQTYIGDGQSTGLNALDKITDVNLISIPGIGTRQVVSAGFGYCVNRPLSDCFFIADLGGTSTNDPLFNPLAPYVTTFTGARDYVRSLPTKNDYGAIYFPWIVAADPIGKGKNPRRVVPPSGFVAGMYARIDSKRGVFKAPAGTDANLSGVLNLAAQIDDVQQDFLNPIGINVIRSFPASGVVIWGARTLSSDSAYRYVPVRRMAIFLRVSIYNGIQWAVFEPNDEDLWASLRLTIGAFMLTQFRAGAFQGEKPSDAFFVKCDATTTIQADIDNGVVNILVGFAPLKPAEFVVVKLSQIAGQSPT